MVTALYNQFQYDTVTVILGHDHIQFYSLLSIVTLAAILNRLFVLLRLIKCFYMAMDVCARTMRECLRHMARRQSAV